MHMSCILHVCNMHVILNMHVKYGNMHATCTVFPVGLTAARIRGAQEAKCNSVTASKRLDGLIPVIEDWRTKVIILEVCGLYVDN